MIAFPSKSKLLRTPAEYDRWLVWAAREAIQHSRVLLKAMEEAKPPTPNLGQKGGSDDRF